MPIVQIGSKHLEDTADPRTSEGKLTALIIRALPEMIAGAINEVDGPGKLQPKQVVIKPYRFHPLSQNVSELEIDLQCDETKKFSKVRRNKIAHTLANRLENFLSDVDRELLQKAGRPVYDVDVRPIESSGVTVKNGEVIHSWGTAEF